VKALDANDILRAHGEDGLRETIDATPAEPLPPNSSRRSIADAEPRFRLYAFNDIKPDAAANYLIKSLFPRVGLAVIWGPPKCGKSFWAFDALMHVALGWNYRGHRVASGVVVYCALEGVQGFKNRVEAFRLAKLSEADGGPPPFYLMPRSLSLVADCKALIADIRRREADRGLHRHAQSKPRRLGKLG
jgi:hypothetical protein